MHYIMTFSHISIRCLIIFTPVLSSIILPSCSIPFLNNPACTFKPPFRILHIQEITQPFRVWLISQNIMTSSPTRSEMRSSPWGMVLRWPESTFSEWGINRSSICVVGCGLISKDGMVYGFGVWRILSRYFVASWTHFCLGSAHKSLPSLVLKTMAFREHLLLVIFL